MKKLVVATLLLSLSFQLSFAQNSFDEMRKEMEKMQKEMFKQFEQLDLNGQGFQFFLDTTMTQNFGDPNMPFNDQIFGQIDPSMFNDVFEEMQKQLSQMDEQDWIEIEQLFKNFGMMMPPQPFSPENPGNSNQPKDKPTKKAEKKRKIYKM